MIGSYTITEDSVSYGFNLVYTEAGGWKHGLKTIADLLDLELGTLIEPDSKLSYAEFNQGAATARWLSPDSPKAVAYDWAKKQMDFDTPEVSNFRICHLIDPVALSDWLNAKNYSPEQLNEFLVDTVKQGITELSEASQFIVVNEPYIYPDRINDPFYTSSGNNYDYIELAYQTARDTAQEINPDIRLIYNDTNNHSLADPVEKGFTTALTQKIVDRLKAGGLVDGVGMQMHVRAGNPPDKHDMIRTMQRYGIPVLVTELDVDLSDIGESDERRWAVQAKIYKDIIEACLESGVCNSITVWGIGDNYSWLEVNQGKSSADPTLFFGPDKDGNFSPKPAYYAVLQVLLDTLTSR